VWVTGPDYYLDEDGAERQDLDPGHGYEPGGWWTCHRETEQGDLVLLYRARLKKDLAYLIETRSAAYSILDDPGAKPGWDYGCDWEIIEKFPNPLTLGEMRSDPVLKDWGVLRANFRRRVYEITPDIWNHLLDRLAVDKRKVDR
jgi:predicted RNA-binding protein with PUA-like domain